LGINAVYQAQALALQLCLTGDGCAVKHSRSAAEVHGEALARTVNCSYCTRSLQLLG